MLRRLERRMETKMATQLQLLPMKRGISLKLELIKIMSTITLFAVLATVRLLMQGRHLQAAAVVAEAIKMPMLLLRYLQVAGVAANVVVNPPPPVVELPQSFPATGA